VEDDVSPFGPLTQRLVQGLLEENLITPLDDASLMSEAGELSQLLFIVMHNCMSSSYTLLVNV